MVVLSPATIAAQQRLSEQFGITTFGLKGGISTVPKTRKLSSINVGVGAFQGETRRSFTSTLQKIIDATRSSGGGKIGNTFILPNQGRVGKSSVFVPSTSKTQSSPSSSNIPPLLLDGSIVDPTRSGLSSTLDSSTVKLTDFAKNNPFLSAAIVLTGLFLMMIC